MMEKRIDYAIGVIAAGVAGWFHAAGNYSMALYCALLVVLLAGKLAGGRND